LRVEQIKKKKRERETRSVFLIPICPIAIPDLMKIKIGNWWMRKKETVWPLTTEQLIKGKNIFLMSLLCVWSGD